MCHSRRRGFTNTNGYPHSYSHADLYTYSYSYCDGDGHGHCHGYVHADTYSDANRSETLADGEAPANNTAAETIVGNITN